MHEARIKCFCLQADTLFPSEGNFYAASSRGRYGNAFRVTGVLKHEYKHPMHLTLAGGRL